MRRCRAVVTAGLRLQQPGDGRAMTAEIEQEGAHVRRGLHQHDEEGFGVEDGHDRQATPELDHGGIEIATSTRVAELRYMLDRGAPQRGDTSGIHATRAATI